MSKRQPAEFFPLNLAILTLSDSRTAATDTSGDALQQLAETAGHRVCERALLPHNRYAIRALVSHWIASERVQVVVLNGGTGFAAGNCTPEAIRTVIRHRSGRFRGIIPPAELCRYRQQQPAIAGAGRYGQRHFIICHSRFRRRLAGKPGNN